jgi:prevent-host-death family protein
MQPCEISDIFVYFASHLEHTIMQKFTTVELLRDLKTVTHAATREPVAITQHRKPRFVLMAIEDFERLSVQPDVRRAYQTTDTPPDLAGLIIEGLDRINNDEEGADGA